MKRAANGDKGANLDPKSKRSPAPKRQTNEVKTPKKTDNGLQDINNRSCAFCHTSECTEESGEILSYAQGKEVVGDEANVSKVIHVHVRCRNWTPQIFFNANGLIQNLESEVARANKLKCSRCGKKGAGLGCYLNTCQRSYHVPCAYETSDCRWDFDAFLIFCPKHTSNKFPSEMKSKSRKRDTDKKYETSLLNAGSDLVFCGSDLSSEQKYYLVEFATSNRAIVSKNWKDTVTHVIVATDSDGACTRTFKFLMAILNGKWIVTFEWVKACMDAGCIVKEEPYEVHLDTHGCSGGPKAGRLRVLNNGPKLFKNMRFYFIGDFVQDYKTDLITLVTTGGGTISANKDQLLLTSNDVNVKVKQVTLVVYNADVSEYSEYESEESTKFQRLAAAEDLAAQVYGSWVVEHIWILESVAACSLLPFT